jgi:hypothetical protein
MQPSSIISITPKEITLSVHCYNYQGEGLHTQINPSALLDIFSFQTSEN